MTDGVSDLEQKTLKVLNDGLRAHMATQDPSADWSSIMRYYMQQAATIRKKPEPRFSAPASAPAQPAPKAVPGTPSVQPPTPQKQPPTTPGAAPSRNIFGTPKPSGPSDLLQPPRTAPVNKNKRRAEDDAERAPATEKRVRSDAPVEYPSLPDNASETARKFQAALKKPEPDFDAAKRQAEKEAKEKTERERLEKEKQSQTSNGGFKPAGFTPAGSGMPNFSAPSAGSNGFLASFDKKAGAEEDKERKKRKDNDYDSDEETEEAWAARDKIEQEAKRKKILADAKKGSGFVISATPSAAVSESGDTDNGSDKESATGGSLFDRITPRDAPKSSGLFSGASKPTSNMFGTPAAGSNIFGHLSQPASDKDSVSSKDFEQDSVEPEKEAGPGDNTWKPNTPIKFGASTSNPTESTTPAAPPPVFGNLFGTAQKTLNDNTGHLNVPGSKPTFGFNFGGQPGSLGTSRASTPGFTTDGEGASTAGEEEDQPPPQEEQVEDQTGLLAEEQEHEDVLLQVPVAKGAKFDEKKDPDTGEMAPGWVEQCKGPLYILKNKESGKVRVLLKVPPLGRPRMNFHPVKKMSYEAIGKKGTMIQGVFVDHFDTKNPTKLSKWLITVGKAEDAKEIARLLDDEAKKE